MMFGRCCKKLVKVAEVGDIWTITSKRPSFQIKSLQHLKVPAVAMTTSSANEPKCRRLDGKVAVVTASTAGCVYFVSFTPWSAFGIVWQCINIQDDILNYINSSECNLYLFIIIDVLVTAQITQRRQLDV